MNSEIFFNMSDTKTIFSREGMMTWSRYKELDLTCSPCQKLAKFILWNTIIPCDGDRCLSLKKKFLDQISFILVLPLKIPIHISISQCILAYQKLQEALQ